MTDDAEIGRTVVARTLHAQNLILSKQGQVKAMLFASEEGPIFHLFHGDAKIGVEISIREGRGPCVVLCDANGKPGAEISIPETGPRILFSDANGTRRATLEVLSEPPGAGPWLGLFDANGDVRACLGVKESGLPWLQFFDASGKLSANLMAMDNGPWLALGNPKGKQEMRLSMSDSGTAELFMGEHGPSEDQPTVGPSLKLAVNSEGPCLLFGKDNKVFWSAPPAFPPAPTQPDSNVKGVSASMSHSPIKDALKAFGLIVLIMCGLGAYSALDSSGYVQHSATALISVSPKWMVGESKVCSSPSSIQLDTQFTCGDLDSDDLYPKYHMMEVKFYGQVSQPEHKVRLWRCRRETDSFTCWQTGAD